MRPPPAEEIETVMPSRNLRPRHELSEKEVQKRKPCQTCYETAKKTHGWRVARNLKRIRTYCKGCEGEPHLCITCFNKKHRYAAK